MPSLHSTLVSAVAEAFGGYASPSSPGFRDALELARAVVLSQFHALHWDHLPGPASGPLFDLLRVPLRGKPSELIEAAARGDEGKKSVVANGKLLWSGVKNRTLPPLESALGSEIAWRLLPWLLCHLTLPTEFLSRSKRHDTYKLVGIDSRDLEWLKISCLQHPKLIVWLSHVLPESLPSAYVESYALEDAHAALLHALYGDVSDFRSIREVAARDPNCSVVYACFMDSGPHPVTRRGASADPWAALYYARLVDSKPSDETREGACRSPHTAFLYAKQVDGRPRPDTRAAASRNPFWAIEYAREVDKRPHRVTRDGARSESWAYSQYLREVDGLSPAEAEEKAWNCLGERLNALERLRTDRLHRLRK